MVGMTTRDLARGGRRRFLNGLASLGVSGMALRYMTDDVLADLTSNPKKEVPRLGYLRHKNPDKITDKNTVSEREPVYYTIPRDEWIVVESARDARKQIKDSLASLSPTPSVYVQTGTSNHHRRKEIVVYHTVVESRFGDVVSRPSVSFEDLADRVPATINGVAGRGSNSERVVEDIPVRVEREVKTKDEQCDDSSNYFAHEYCPIPAGCIMNDQGCYHSTIGMPAYSKKYNEQVLVAAGHALDTPYENTVYQNDAINQDIIGEADDEDVYVSDKWDAGVIRLNSGINTEYAIATNGSASSKWPILGIMTESRLLDFENKNRAIYRNGCTTGSESGRVVGVSETQFKTNMPRSSGDSGGPYFERIDHNGFNSYIAGIHEGHDGNGNTTATQSRNIEIGFNLQI